MAIMKNGILGGITGKLGNAVYYVVNGKQYVRVHTVSMKPRTEKQLLLQAEMGIVNEFLRPVKALVNIGYGIEAKKQKRKAYNMVFGYLKKYALKGEGDNRQIDFTKVRLSSGGFPDLRETAAELNNDQLTLSWSPELYGDAWGSDRVMVLVYFPIVEPYKNAFALSLIGESQRAEGGRVIQLPLHMEGRPIEVYVFVLAADGKAVSNTQYLGRL